MALQTFAHGITAVDTLFQRPLFDASHLVVEDASAVFIDVGTNAAVPILLAALGELGLGPEAVEYVILTHVHLDHAGGAGEIMRRLPRARLVVHPRGARHMTDPAKLWAGAAAVYGEDAMRRNYGTLVPIPAERVLEAPDGFELYLGGRRLLLLDTPGHARHHVCIWDEASRGMFTGDTFGLAYPELASDEGPLLVPTTTPVQFEPEALHASIDRLAGFEPEAVYLTHYSRVSGAPGLASGLHRRIDQLTALARAYDGRPDRAARLRGGVRELMLGWAQEHGTRLPPERVRDLLAIDVELNAQGLEVWLDRARRVFAGGSVGNT